MSARPRDRVNGVSPQPLDMPLPEVAPERVELLGLGVMVTVMERLDAGERRRALAYLADRFGHTLLPAGVERLPDLDALVTKLTARRHVVGMSQRELADKLGTQQSAVSEWETGKSKPGGTLLFAIADVLGCDIALVERGSRRG
jgi:DNA-binding XRE family transcriptional regulator